MEEKIIPAISKEEFKGLSQPMALDFTALFILLEEEVLRLIRKAGKEEWTLEELESAIEELI